MTAEAVSAEVVTGFVFDVDGEPEMVSRLLGALQGEMEKIFMERPPEPVRVAMEEYLLLPQGSYVPSPRPFTAVLKLKTREVAA